MYIFCSVYLNAAYLFFIILKVKKLKIVEFANKVDQDEEVIISCLILI